MKHTAEIPAFSHNVFGSISHLVTGEVSQRKYATKTGKTMGEVLPFGSVESVSDTMEEPLLDDRSY